MDWQTAEDSTAPEGWTNLGLDNDVGDFESCGDGWNGYARKKTQGQLYATMKGAGRATVKYRDCLGEGFATLYLNGKQLDKSQKNTGKLRMFRSLGSLGINASCLSAKLGIPFYALYHHVVLASGTATS